MQEKARIFKSSWFYSRFLIHFSIRKKVAYFVFKDSSSPFKASNFNSHNPDLLTLTTKSNQNITNLRCTADHHAVPPLNRRPVESGIIPDYFSTGLKTYPAHHDLWAGPTTPAVFKTNIRSSRSRPAHCRSVYFSRAVVDRLSGVNGVFK